MSYAVFYTIVYGNRGIETEREREIYTEKVVCPLQRHRAVDHLSGNTSV